MHQYFRSEHPIMKIWDGNWASLSNLIKYLMFTLVCHVTYQLCWGLRSSGTLGWLCWGRPLTWDCRSWGYEDRDSCSRIVTSTSATHQVLYCVIWRKPYQKIQEMISSAKRLVNKIHTLRFIPFSVGVQYTKHADVSRSCNPSNESNSSKYKKKNTVVKYTTVNPCTLRVPSPPQLLLRPHTPLAVSKPSLK